MPSIEIELKNRSVQAEILEQKEDKLKISIDGKLYDLDVRKVEPGIYSLLYKGRSYEMHISAGPEKNEYNVQLNGHAWDIQILDEELRFHRSHNNGKVENGMRIIFSPMPGKVVKIPVSPGDEVKEGQTLIIISAMKMESEYKAPVDGKIKEILTEEGAIIEGNQTLITLE